MAKCKYYKEQKYVSHDGGESWEALDEYRVGDLYERDSVDCEEISCNGEIQVPSNVKALFFGEYFSRGGHIPCNSSSSLNNSDFTYLYTDSWSLNNPYVYIGECVTEIDNTLSGQYEELYLPSSLKTINGNSLNGGMSLLVCKATLPPRLVSVEGYSDPMSIASISSIKVPKESVQLYKTTLGWSRYANVITAI